MNFFTYLGITEDEFIEKYLQAGWVNEGVHQTLPLNIFCYSRKCQYENNWDPVISKCRGIVVDRVTREIVGRPFQKFHNYGSPQGEATPVEVLKDPVVWEKMDGFMVTAFKYNGLWHAASKSSFHSIHAEWATAELRRHENNFPEGFTPMFEGLHPDLRIVVDYGTRQELVLLSLVHNETGGELLPNLLREWALENGYAVPRSYVLTLEQAIENSRDETKNAEGYVLTWYQENAVPVRLKMKFIEYLRLHRLVCGVSPKRIWEAMSDPAFKADLDEYLNNSTPWFAQFVRKWKAAVQMEYDTRWAQAEAVYMETVREMAPRHLAGEFASLGDLRKAYALVFTKPEHEKIRAVMFAMLDGKDASVVLWKQVKEMTLNGHPMIDAHSI